MNKPFWSAALSLRAQRKRLSIPAPQISNVQRMFPWISYSFKLKCASKQQNLNIYS